jgi:hypothetical protein
MGSDNRLTVSSVRIESTARVTNIEMSTRGEDIDRGVDQEGDTRRSESSTRVEREDGIRIGRVGCWRRRSCEAECKTLRMRRTAEWRRDLYT